MLSRWPGAAPRGRERELLLHPLPCHRPGVESLVVPFLLAISLPSFRFTGDPAGVLVREPLRELGSGTIVTLRRAFERPSERSATRRTARHHLPVQGRHGQDVGASCGPPPPWCGRRLLSPSPTADDQVGHVEDATRIRRPPAEESSSFIISRQTFDGGLGVDLRVGTSSTIVHGRAPGPPGPVDVEVPETVCIHPSSPRRPPEGRVIPRIGEETPRAGRCTPVFGAAALPVGEGARPGHPQGDIDAPEIPRAWADAGCTQSSAFPTLRRRRTPLVSCGRTPDAGPRATSLRRHWTW